MPIRVSLADDQTLVRSGLRFVLESAGDIRVVGEASDGAEAVDLAIRERPHVAVMDIRMSGMDGIEATRRLLARAPSTRVLVVTSSDDDECVLEALHAGAAGYLLKDAAPDSLVPAIRAVAAGEAILAPSVTRRLVDRFVRQTRPDARLSERLEELTAREAEIATLVARGMTNAEIAGSVHLGENTVKSHVTAILRKLGLRNRSQVVVMAYESGLVAIGEAGI